MLRRPTSPVQADAVRGQQELQLAAIRGGAGGRGLRGVEVSRGERLRVERKQRVSRQRVWQTLERRHCFLAHQRPQWRRGVGVQTYAVDARLLLDARPSESWFVEAVLACGCLAQDS